MKKLLIFVFLCFLCSFGTASATFIDNDLADGTLGAFRVDALSGGESRAAYLTANRQASGDVYVEDLLYDYFSYVDVGNGGFRLNNGTVDTSQAANDMIRSTGSFTGSGGNTINWTCTSAMVGDIYRNTFEFQAQTGELGDISLYQYMDEDVESVSDDVFFTRGSVATNDLELFTVDNTEVYGVSHGGSLTAEQGLLNANFAGWAVDDYNRIKPRITAGTQAVSQSGVNPLGEFTHADVGTAYGLNDDIVSVLAWDVIGNQSYARIVTTLGGVPDIMDIPPVNPVIPEPGTMFLLGFGLLGVSGIARRKKA